MSHTSIVSVQIEVPQLTFTKWNDKGSADFVSPLPCPFNYGSVLGNVAADGEPHDAIVLGPWLPRGSLVMRKVIARAKFVDQGIVDDKLICGERGFSVKDRAQVWFFLHAYARAKQLTNLDRNAALFLGFG